MVCSGNIRNKNAPVLDRFWLLAFSSLIDAREAFLVLQITQNSISKSIRHNLWIIIYESLVLVNHKTDLGDQKQRFHFHNLIFGSDVAVYFVALEKNEIVSHDHICHMIMQNDHA